MFKWISKYLSTIIFISLIIYLLVKIFILSGFDLLTGIILILFVTSIFLTNFKVGHIIISYVTILEILITVFSALITHWFGRFTDPILSAGLIGFTGYLISKLDKSFVDIQFAAFCGAFVGMSKLSFYENYFYLIISAMISGFFYLLMKNHFQGFGGKLGAIAFVGVYIVFFLFGG